MKRYRDERAAALAYDAAARLLFGDSAAVNFPDEAAESAEAAGATARAVEAIHRRMGAATPAAVQRHMVAAAAGAALAPVSNLVPLGGPPAARKRVRGGDGVGGNGGSSSSSSRLQISAAAAGASALPTLGGHVLLPPAGGGLGWAAAPADLLSAPPSGEGSSVAAAILGELQLAEHVLDALLDGAPGAARLPPLQADGAANGLLSAPPQGPCEHRAPGAFSASTPAPLLAPLPVSCRGWAMAAPLAGGDGLP